MQKCFLAVKYFCDSQVLMVYRLCPLLRNLSASKGGSLRITQYLFVNNRGTNWWSQLASTLQVSVMYEHACIQHTHASATRSSYMGCVKCMVEYLSMTSFHHQATLGSSMLIP